MTVAEQAQAVGDYWKAHPDPDDVSTWAPYQNHAEAKQAYRAANGGPPEPPVVPGPATPGAGMAVARAGDITNHGATIGPVTTGVAARVMIGGACSMPSWGRARRGFPSSTCPRNPIARWSSGTS